MADAPAYRGMPRVRLAARKRLAMRRGSLVYLTLPYCPWAKGRTEYTNRPFRQYIPKNSQFPPLTREQTKQMQNKTTLYP